MISPAARHANTASVAHGVGGALSSRGAVVVVPVLVMPNGVARIAPRNSAGRFRLWVKRNQATTAMVLAERVARRIGDHTDKDWLFIYGWAEELGLSGPTAVSKISYTEHDLR